MLGLGTGEMILLALVGIFVVGPERFPAAIRSAARAVGQVKQYATALRDQVNGDELAEVRRHLEELREPLAELRDADPRRAWREALRDDPAPRSSGAVNLTK